jgi:hypothetical protein
MPIPCDKNFIIATIFPLTKADHIYVAAVLAQAPTAPSPRGVKRSRSPDQLEESWVGADDDGTYDFLRDGFTVSTRTTSIYTLGKYRFHCRMKWASTVLI